MLRWIFIFIFSFLSEEIFAEDLSSASAPFMAKIIKTAESFGDPVVDRLVAFKYSVQNSAYDTTLKLCEGYRRARNLGPHPYHGKWVYSLDQAVGAWTKIAREGATQPLTALGGLKSDYLVLNNAGFFDFESWFGSMYSFYLVNSLGFLGAATHCLNTMNQKEIHYFAAAILAVDYEMSLATHAGLGWTSGKILSLIIKATRFVWNPLGKIIKIAQVRVGQTPIRIAGIFLGGVVADNLLLYAQKREQSLEVIQSIYSQEGALNNDLRRRGRFLTLNHAYEIAIAQRQEEVRLKNANQIVDENRVYKPFYDHLKENFDMETIQKMDEDLEFFQNKTFLSPEESAYKDLLSGFLPIIKNFF